MHASKDFELGAAAILGIAFVVWLGVRGMTWFLFASHGTPVMMAVIQGKGLGGHEAGVASQPGAVFMEYYASYYERLKSDAAWLRAQGEDLLAALMAPPLQLVAACLNFLTLLVSGRPLFKLPFKSLEDLADAASSLRAGARRAPAEAARPASPSSEVRP